MDTNKVILAKLKVYLSAGEAKATPPLGPLLGQYGVNTVQFCKEFNEAMEGFLDFFLSETSSDVNISSFELIVYMYVYDDRKFAFDMQKPSTSFLLRLLASVDKGNPKMVKFSMSSFDLISMALFKYPTDKLYSSSSMIKGTASSMGMSII